MRRLAVASDTLASIQYHPRRHWLDLEFCSGERYRYFKVPLRRYQELLHAESKGRYFNQMIRNHFPYQHLTQTRSPIFMAAAPKN